jgi:hypothetical protein
VAPTVGVAAPRPAAPATEAWLDDGEAARGGLSPQAAVHHRAPAPTPRAPRIWDLEPEAQEAAVMRVAQTAVPASPLMGAAPSAAPAASVAAAPARTPAPTATPAPMPAPMTSPAPAVAPAALQAGVPSPALAPDATRRPGGRVRTRLLGFHSADDLAPDPMAAGPVARPAGPAQFPVGWVVVIDGPGRGAAFTLAAGVSSIGRDETQAIQLDFGDTAISRQMHAAVAYDPETRGFFLGHGGKSNIVRLNGRPVLSTEDLKDGDVIRIGETTLKLVAFCGRNFDWADGARDADGDRA